MNKSPRIFSEGLSYNPVDIFTWVKQFCRALLFLIDPRRRTVILYELNIQSGRSCCAVLQYPSQLETLERLSGVKYKYLISNGKVEFSNGTWRIIEVKKIQIAYLVYDLFLSFLPSVSTKFSKIDIPLKDQPFELDSKVKFDFLNDQNFFSRLSFRYIDVKKTSVYQHGLIAFPNYFFPVNARYFYGYQYLTPDALADSIARYRPWAPVAYYGEKQERVVNSRSRVLIATHSAIRDTQLIIYARITSRDVCCKIHPSAHFKVLYKVLKLFLDFKVVDTVIDGLNECDELWTIYSSLALDARIYGLKVVGYKGLRPQPWFVQLSAARIDERCFRRLLSKRVMICDYTG